MLYLLLWSTLRIRVFELEQILWGLQYLGVVVSVHRYFIAPCKYLPFELYLERFHSTWAVWIVANELYLAKFPRVVLLLVKNHLRRALWTAKTKHTTYFGVDNCLKVDLTRIGVKFLVQVDIFAATEDRDRLFFVDEVSVARRNQLSKYAVPNVKDRVRVWRRINSAIRQPLGCSEFKSVILIADWRHVVGIGCYCKTFVDERPFACEDRRVFGWRIRCKVGLLAAVYSHN